MKLPLEIYPPVICFQDRAFPLCMFLANYKKDINEWLCSHYFHASYNKETGEGFDIFHDDKWFTKEGIFVENEYKGIEVITWERITDLMRKGYYIYGKWDEFYVPDKNTYNERHYEHDFLFYGFDKENKHFESIGYLQSGKFQPFQVEFDDYLNSVETLPREHFFLNAYKYNTMYDYVFSMERFKEDLYDYLYEINLSRSDKQEKLAFGIGTWNRLCLYFSTQVECKTGLDIRYARCYWEHKAIMHRRLTYLTKIMKMPSSIIERHYEVEKVARLIFLLTIKFNITGRENVYLSIQKQLRTNIEGEYEILMNLLKNL